MKQRLYPLCCALLLLGLLCPAPYAQGESLSMVYTTRGEARITGGDTPYAAEAIRWWYDKKDRTYDLFVPSGTQSLRLWFDSPRSISVNGQTLQSGDDASFLLTKDVVTLTAGKKTYPLKVMRSSNVPAMFITTQSGSLNSIHQRKGNEESIV